MRTDLAQLLLTALYYIAAYALCCIVSMVIIGTTLRFLINSDADLKNTYKGTEHKFFSIARVVGSLEQIMYITSILIGMPEFIGVWLVVKAIDEYKQTDRKYSIYLIGTSLSLIFAVGTAMLM